MDDCNEVLKAVDIAVSKLDSLSKAFYVTGNIELSNKLANISDLIFDVPREIRDIHHKANMEIINRGNEQLGKIITTIMDKSERASQC